MIAEKNCTCYSAGDELGCRFGRISLRGGLTNWTKEDILSVVNNNMNQIDIKQLIDPIRDELGNSWGSVGESEVKNIWSEL